MGKPILIIRLPKEISEEDLRKSAKKFRATLTDYHVIVVDDEKNNKEYQFDFVK